MKKKIIILFILIFLYFIVLFIFNNNKVVYIGDYTKVYIKNKKISKIENINSYISGKKVKYYQNNSFYDGYLYSEKGDLGYAYNILNKNKTKEIIRNGIIATTNNITIKVKEPEELKVSESEIDSITDGLNIEKSSIKSEKTKKYIFDLNSDSTDEIIYIIVYKESNGEKVEFVLYSDSKYSVFESYLVDNTSAVRKNENLYMFIDFLNAGNYCLLIQYSPKLEVPFNYKIYEYNNNNLSIIE